MIRMTRRERWFAIGLISLAVCWVLFAYCIRPAAERIETLNRVIPEKQKEIEQLRANSDRYLALRSGLDNYKRKAAAQEKDFELLSFLESINSRSHLADKVTAMKQQVLQLDSNYCEIIVETEIQNLTLKQLMDFLLKIESSDRLLRIKSLYTKKNPANPNLLDSVIQISTLKLNAPARRG